MQGLVGNARDRTYLEALGYRKIGDNQAGIMSYEKTIDPGLIRRVVLRYPERCIEISLYQFDVHRLEFAMTKKPERFSLANLREQVTG